MPWRWCVRLATILVLAGCVVVGVGAARKPSFWVTPLEATLRCAEADPEDCGETDRLRADSFGVYEGSLQTNEGAFINSNGGFSLRQVANTSVPERYLWLDLTTKVTPRTACGLTPSTLVAATESDMRINVEGDGGTTLGIDNLTPGTPYAGFGILNYRDPAHASVWWTVRWATGALVVTKTGEHSWDIRSSPGHLALLQCTRQRGRDAGGDEGEYRVPFAITVVRQG